MSNTASTYQEVFDSASLWTGISAALAAVLAITATDVSRPLLIGWVSAQVALALVAFLLAQMSKSGKGGKLMALRPAHAIIFLSVTAWSFGVLLLSKEGADGANLPIYLVASGLACASIWLLQGEAILMAAAQVCLLLPMLYRLLITDTTVSLVSALVFAVLVIANAFIARRMSVSHGNIGASDVNPLNQRSSLPLASKQLQAQESQFQTERMAEELRVELERHRGIEEELKAAKQTAEAANMAKGEFLATMSHEIRTPLNGIIPLLEILRDSKLQPDQRDYLNTAYTSSKQLLSIIDDILDYSKIEANKLELESTGMNLREVLDNVARLMERAATQKALKLSVKLDPNVRIAMRGDPTRLRQVLTNLVSNAVKFTEKGGIQVDIQKRSETRTHQELMFAVKDTGVGISQEGQAKLFKAFQQADTSTTRVFGGTGLGLVICQRIVALMGGQIGVKSEVGKGSVFWFTVPILKAQGDIGAGRRDVNGVRALLISNDQRMTQRFNPLLTKQGITLTSSTTTADAMSKLKSSATLGENWAFELVVLDVNSLRSTLPQFVRSALRETSLERVRFLLVQSGEPLSADALDPKRCGSVMLNSGETELSQVLNRLLEVQTGAQQQFSLLADAAKLGEDSFGPTAGMATRQAAGPLTGHVLLVEDNPVNRAVALKVVTKIGVSVESAENGQEALEKLASGQFDLVLMDCQMPVMDGYTSTRTRRTLEDERKLARIPIIAMTANAMVGDREKCLASGMDDYLTKPLNLQLLEEIMRKWMPVGAKTRAIEAASIGPQHSANGYGLAQPAPLQQATSASDAMMEQLPGVNLDGVSALFGTPAFALNEEVAKAPSAGNVPRAQAAPPQAAPVPQAPLNVQPTKPALPEKPAIDRSIFDELLDIMGSEFAALVRVYLEDTPKNLRILAQASQQGDVAGMVAPAHSLKSTSANLGALGLSDIAKKIETGARTGNLPEPVAMAKKAIAEFERAATELKKLIG